MAFPRENARQRPWLIEVWKQCDHCDGSGHEKDSHETYQMEVANTALSICHCCNGWGKIKHRAITLAELDLAHVDSFLSKLSAVELSTIR
jgi:iron only hydrogenase large subunit-like protein